MVHFMLFGIDKIPDKLGAAFGEAIEEVSVYDTPWTPVVFTVKLENSGNPFV